MIEKLVAGAVTPLFGAMMAFGIADMIAQSNAEERRYIVDDQAARGSGQTPTAESRRPGPKEKTKELVGRAVGGAPIVPPVEEGAADRTGRPKVRDKIMTNVTVGGAPIIVPIEAAARARDTPGIEHADPSRRREGPKGDVDHGRTTGAPVVVTPPR